MNNKGQSLVLFVLIIPICFLVLLMVYDISSMVLLKNELDDINYLALDYGVDHLEEDMLDSKLEELINKNRLGISTNIKIIDDKLYIDLSDNINNRLSLFNKANIFSVKSSYVGYIEDDKKIIKKNR